MDRYLHFASFFFFPGGNYALTYIIFLLLYLISLISYQVPPTTHMGRADLLILNIGVAAATTITTSLSDDHDSIDADSDDEETSCILSSVQLLLGVALAKEIKRIEQSALLQLATAEHLFKEPWVLAPDRPTTLDEVFLKFGPDTKMIEEKFRFQPKMIRVLIRELAIPEWLTIPK
jgi:hypothetical protein